MCHCHQNQDQDQNRDQEAGAQFNTSDWRYTLCLRPRAGAVDGRPVRAPVFWTASEWQVRRPDPFDTFDDFDAAVDVDVYGILCPSDLLASLRPQEPPSCCFDVPRSTLAPSWRALGQSSGITGRDGGRFRLAPSTLDRRERSKTPRITRGRSSLSIRASCGRPSMWGPFVSGRDGGSTSETADVVSLRDVRDHRSSSAQELTALFGPVGLDCATRGCRAAFGSRPPSSRAAWWSIESVGTRRVRWGKRLDSQTIGYERGTRGDARTEPYF